MSDCIFIKQITTVTLIGVDTSKYPVNGGNCFSVTGTDNKNYRIVNFSYENMQEVIERGLKLPVKILPLSEKVAIVIDERIPDRWFDTRYCEVCCPEYLLPHQQVMAHRRQEARGERTIRNTGEFQIISIDPTKKVKYLPGEEKEKKEDEERRKKALDGWKFVETAPIRAFFSEE